MKTIVYNIVLQKHRMEESGERLLVPYTPSKTTSKKTAETIDYAHV